MVFFKNLSSIAIQVNKRARQRDLMKDLTIAEDYKLLSLYLLVKLLIIQQTGVYYLKVSLFLNFKLFICVDYSWLYFNVYSPNFDIARQQSWRSKRGTGPVLDLMKG